MMAREKKPRSTTTSRARRNPSMRAGNVFCRKPGRASARDGPAGHGRRRRRGSWCSLLHENSRWHYRRPLFTASGVLVGADNRGVNQMQRSRKLFRQYLEYPQPHAFLGPSVETVIDPRVGPVPLRQVAPWRARAQNEEDAIENSPIILARQSPRSLFSNSGPMIPHSASARSNRAIVQASAVWKPESQVASQGKPLYGYRT